VIIGGLYWKKGTTAAAWSALITGSIVAVGGSSSNNLIPISSSMDSSSGVWPCWHPRLSTSPFHCWAKR